MCGGLGKGVIWDYYNVLRYRGLKFNYIHSTMQITL